MNDLYSQKKARIGLPFNRQKVTLLLAFSDRDVPLNTPHYCQLNIHFSFTLGICMRRLFILCQNIDGAKWGLWSWLRGPEILCQCCYRIGLGHRY